MTVDMDLIHGVSLGIEYVEEIPEEDIPATIILDIIILRFLIQW